jgi:hypothetical protein
VIIQWLLAISCSWWLLWRARKIHKECVLGLGFAGNLPTQRGWRFLSPSLSFRARTNKQRAFYGTIPKRVLLCLGHLEPQNFLAMVLSLVIH